LGWYRVEDLNDDGRQTTRDVTACQNSSGYVKSYIYGRGVLDSDSETKSENEMRIYYYYSRVDNSREKLGKTTALSRLRAAQIFARRKDLPLKTFLTIYSISK
jgi:hypothetical protein